MSVAMLFDIWRLAPMSGDPAFEEAFEGSVWKGGGPALEAITHALVALSVSDFRRRRRPWLDNLLGASVDDVVTQVFRFASPSSGFAPYHRMLEFSVLWTYFLLCDRQATHETVESLKSAHFITHTAPLVAIPWQETDGAYISCFDNPKLNIVDIWVVSMLDTFNHKGDGIMILDELLANNAIDIVGRWSLNSKQCCDSRSILLVREPIT